MYRPTVRCHDVYRDYVNHLFQSTILDRNQIIRAALFSAAHSPTFLKLMNENKRSDVPLPSSLWTLDQAGLWMEQNPNVEERACDVNVRGRKDKIDIGYSEQSKQQKESSVPCGRHRPDQGRERQVREGGGYKIRIS